MNILILTPYSFTDGRKEAEKITDIFEIAGHSVSSAHTMDGVLSKVDRVWDAIWLIGHGSEEGFQFNGDLLSYKQLIPIINTGETRLLFFNSCNSVYTAISVNETLLIDVVATIGDVRNDNATITSTLFATNFVKYLDPEIAYAKSKPGLNRDYVFLRGRRMIGGEKMDEIKDDVSAIKAKIAVVEYEGNTRGKKLDEVEDRIEVIERRIGDIGIENRMAMDLTKREWTIMIIGTILWLITMLSIFVLQILF